MNAVSRWRGIVLTLSGALLLPALALVLVADADEAARAPGRAAPLDPDGRAALAAPPAIDAPTGAAPPEVAATSSRGRPAPDEAPRPAALAYGEVRGRTASALLLGWADGPACVGDPRVDLAVRRWELLVDRTPVDLDFDGATLADALADVARRTGLPIVVPPELLEVAASTAVHLRLRGIRLRSVLNLLVQAQLEGGHGWRLTPERALLTQCDGAWGPGPEVDPDDRLSSRPVSEPDWIQEAERTLAAEVTAEVQGATLGEALEQLAALAGVDLTVDPSVDQELPVPSGARLRGVPARRALEALCAPFDLAISFQNETVHVVPAAEVRARDAERARLDEGWRAFLAGSLEVPAGLTGGTPAELARQLEARGVPVDLDDAAAASTTHVPAATADPLLLVCERVAFAAGVAWTVALPATEAEGRDARPRLEWRGSSDPLEAFLADVQRQLRGETSAPAVEGARRLDERQALRREALGWLSPARLREARRAQDVELGLLLGALVSAVAAADGAHHVDGVAADPRRVERFAALAGWLSVHGPARCAHPDQGPGVEPPRAPGCVPCARRWATSLAAWLATDPAPVGHPCAR